MTLQPSPPMQLDTPLGRAQALYLIDNGNHQNACWVVTLESTRMIEYFDCNDVSMATNFLVKKKTKLGPL